MTDWDKVAGRRISKDRADALNYPVGGHRFGFTDLGMELRDVGGCDPV